MLSLKKPKSLVRLWHRIGFFVLAATAIVGCSFSDHLTKSAVDYNESAEISHNELLLKNIVRASMHMPMKFSGISVLRGNLTAEVSASSSFPLGGDATNVYTISPSGTLRTNPSVEVSPHESQEFARGLNESIEGQTLVNFATYGKPKHLLAHLAVERFRFRLSAKFEEGDQFVLIGPEGGEARIRIDEGSTTKKDHADETQQEYFRFCELNYRNDPELPKEEFDRFSTLVRSISNVGSRSGDPTIVSPKFQFPKEDIGTSLDALVTANKEGIKLKEDKEEEKKPAESENEVIPKEKMFQLEKSTSEIVFTIPDRAISRNLLDCLSQLTPTNQISMNSWPQSDPGRAFDDFDVLEPVHEHGTQFAVVSGTSKFDEDETTVQGRSFELQLYEPGVKSREALPEGVLKSLDERRFEFRVISKASSEVEKVKVLDASGKKVERSLLVEGETTIRSAQRVLEHLGAIARISGDPSHPNIPKIIWPEGSNQEVPIFVLNEGSSADAAIDTSYRGTSYYVSSKHRLTLTTLSIVSTLIDLNKSKEDLPSTPSVINVGS